jgi:hypothetical protein
MSITQSINKLHTLGTRNWDRYDANLTKIYSNSNFSGTYNGSVNKMFNETLAHKHSQRDLATASIRAADSLLKSPS